MNRVAFITAGAKLGGCTVLAMVAESPFIEKTLYSVRYDCCGLVDEKTHLQLAKRQREGTSLCKSCSSAEKEENKRKAKRARLAGKGPAFADEIPIVERRVGVPSGEYLNAIWDRATAMVRRAG